MRSLLLMLTISLGAILCLAQNRNATGVQGHSMPIAMRDNIKPHSLEAANDLAKPDEGNTGQYSAEADNGSADKQVAQDNYNKTGLPGKDTLRIYAGINHNLEIKAAEGPVYMP